MLRTVPKSALEFVKKWEGCRLTSYQDVAGVWTIGYGSTGPHVFPGQTITAAQASALLADDLGIAAKRLEARIGPVVDELSEPQYAALLSFTFNLGANAKWTIWKVLKARKFGEVPAQLMRFTHAGGKVVRGLVNRRAAECALWAEHADDAPPSSVTRSTPTPPTPTDTKPLTQSKSFMTTGAAGIATATVAVGEVSKAVSPFAEQSEIVARVVATLALIAAGLAIAALVFVWMKRRRA